MFIVAQLGFSYQEEHLIKSMLDVACPLVVCVLVICSFGIAAGKVTIMLLFTLVIITTFKHQNLVKE